MQTSNALDPQSPQARAIYDLAIPSTIIFALIFVIVTGAIIYAILRFRGRAGEPDPKQIPGNRKVEIAWTIIPFLIVILLLVMTLSAMNRADPPPAPSPDLVVTGHQFWWQVDYPGSGVITANEIHIPDRQTFVSAPGVKGCVARVLGAGVDSQDEQCAGPT